MKIEKNGEENPDVAVGRYLERYGRWRDGTGPAFEQFPPAAGKPRNNIKKMLELRESLL